MSLTFFDDVFIPAAYLPQVSRFDAEQQVWVWRFNDTDLFMDKNQVSVVFT